MIMLPTPAIYDYELPDPFVTAHFVAYIHLYVLYLNACIRAADKLWAYADLVRDHEDRWSRHFHAPPLPVR